MTEDLAGETPDDRAFDEYVAAAERGEAPDLESFVARHPDATDALRPRLEALRWMLAERRPTDGDAARDVAAGSVDPDGPPFERLGEFRLLRRLGEGGMGLVFLAEQESLGRRVALKILRPERAGSRTAERRFEREVLAVARLQHPHIVTVHATGEANGVRWLAMEHVPGEGLDDRLDAARSGRAPPVPVRDALRWARQIADALDAAHAGGVVHRDVKPSNVLLTEEGGAKLTDFGVAREIDAAASSLTEGFTGSPHYAAPEQVDASRGAITPATDVFALGVTLYEALVGAVPFESPSTGDLFRRILHEEPTPPRRLVPSLPRDVETVVLKALRKDPSRRYPTARAFRDDLDALLELRPPSARPAGPLERAFGWLRRHRGVAAALALVLAAGGTLAVADLVGRVDRGRRHADALADADAAAARGDFDAALSALARAAALDVDPGEVRAREAAVVERRRADRVAKAIADATDARARYEAAREAWRTLGAELDPLRAAWTSRPLTDAETRRRLDGERRHAALGRAAEEAFFRCVEAARVARTLDEGNADADRVLASLYAARYEEAAGRRDREEAAAWSDAVRRHDRDGRFAALLDATGRVSFRRAPADATIRLHRVRALDELEDGGAPRLVPVPRGDDAPPVRPGATVLEVVAAAEGLAPGDLVLALDGHPAATTTWVAASADPRLVPGDVVREIDGAPVDDARSARAALAVARRRAAAVTVTVDRDGARHEVTFDAPAPSDLELDAGPERLRRAGGRARVLRDGRIDERPLAPGVETCATAAPLLPTPSSVLVGDEATLPAGTWVARGTADGHEPLRVVFLVEPDGDATVDVDLLPVGSTPPGFVRIPAGVLRTGGDPEAQNAWPDGRREVAEFLIARFPVPCAAYAEFLNDPAILARIDRFDAPIGYPRAPQNFSTGGFWSRDADGRFVVPPLERRWPIYGISRQDAGEYARWLSARAAEAGDPFRYVLPTEEQWERAARGVDRRRFAHGDVFVPRWIDSLWDAEIADIDPIGACPLDESPFGVHDVTGGVFEWCRGTIEEGMDPLRGGGWSNAFPQFYRLATRIAAAPDWSNASTGMRLVAERATR